VAAYLADHHVMTLATQGADGPWAAAVFYAWHRAALIFLSAPSTAPRAQPAADGALRRHHPRRHGDWKAVKGIQLEGRVELPLETPPIRARLAYAEKFPIVSPLTENPAAIAEALAKIAGTACGRQRMYFIDNQRIRASRAA
jgi:uncharacterized protein YhbP (UPF0306 family)